MNLQAVLFDMDGVIIDTHEPVTRFWNELAAAHGVTLTPADYEAYIYGVPAERTFDQLFPTVIGEVRRQVLSDLQQDELTQHYIPVPGVLDFLQTLKDAGVPTALVTSGERWKVKSVFDQLNLHSFFATAVNSSDIVHGKPAPDCYQLAASRLGVDPARCVVFEDSLAGARAGLAAGARVIGIQASPGLVEKLYNLGVSQVVSDFRQIAWQDQTIMVRSAPNNAAEPATTDPTAQLALWADRLRDISANGYHFASNSYDKDNYERIRTIAMEMMALASGDSIDALEPLRDTNFARPTPLATGDAAIIDDDGRILLIRRGDNNRWAMPGGALGVGETPAQGAVREALEETGVRCEAVGFVGVFDSRLSESRSRHQLYMFAFLCRPLEREPSQPLSHPQEILESRWFAENEIPEEMHGGHAMRIRQAYRFWRGEVGTYWDKLSEQ